MVNIYELSETSTSWSKVGKASNELQSAIWILDHAKKQGFTEAYMVTRSIEIDAEEVAEEAMIVTVVRGKLLTSSWMAREEVAKEG